MTLYTTDDLCHKFLVNRNYLTNLRKADILKGCKIGNKYLYLDDEVRQMMKDYKGLDLSNYEAMIIARQIVENKKKFISK